MNDEYDRMIDCYLISDGPPSLPLRPTPSLLTFIFVTAIAEAEEGDEALMGNLPRSWIPQDSATSREIVHAYK